MHKLTLAALSMACCAAALALAPPPAAAAGQVTPLMSVPLQDLPGKEALMLTVSYPPGGSDPIHRHDAHVFVYVLEGTIQMQARGKPVVTLTPGQTFYESPEDVHVVGRNASDSMPAKFLVFFVKNKGTAPVLPAQ